jgi:hypothetical protein
VRIARSLCSGTTATVSADLHTAVCYLYAQLKDLRPQERTGAERRAAAARQAAARGWLTAMGLDDGQAGEPAYWPRTRWLGVAGTGVMQLPGRQARTSRPDYHARQRVAAKLPGVHESAKEVAD